MECLTVLETARKWDLSPRMVQHHCTVGHIPGAPNLPKSRRRPGPPVFWTTPSSCP